MHIIFFHAMTIIRSCIIHCFSSQTLDQLLLAKRQIVIFVLFYYKEQQKNNYKKQMYFSQFTPKRSLVQRQPKFNIFPFIFFTCQKRKNKKQLPILQNNRKEENKPMSNFFKSKNYHKAYAQLQNTGFFNSDFGHFRIKGICNHIINDHSLFISLTQVLQDIKLTPLRVLKIQILIQHLLQVDACMQENEHLLHLLLNLGLKIKKMIDQETSLNVQHETEPQENNDSGKYLVNDNEIVCQNGTSLILSRIIWPLLQLQKRLIFSYELIYPLPGTPELKLSECWAVLNLLKKFVQISPQIQSIGRYYSSKYAGAMIYLVKVLDVDIQLLYQRIKQFVSGKIDQEENLLKQGFFNIINEEQRMRINQFLQVIQEVQAINESMKLLYLSSSFKVDLVSNQIQMPSLLTVDSNIDLLLTLKKMISCKNGKNWNNICKKAKMLRNASKKQL